MITRLSLHSVKLTHQSLLSVKRWALGSLLKHNNNFLREASFSVKRMEGYCKILHTFCWTVCIAVLGSSWSQLRIEFNPVLSFRSIHYQCWLVAVLDWAAWVWEQRGNVTCKMVYRSKQTGSHCLCAEIIRSIRIRYKRASLFIYGLLGRNGGFIWKCVWIQNRSCDIDWV